MIKDNFPNTIAVFPLSNAIFFPGTILPLNIFEERYIPLVSDCMKEQRLFGMIQPKIKSGQKPEVYRVGCLGKIVSFNETVDKRFIISLSGIIRFKVQEKLNTNKLYREFKVDYSDYINDLKIKKKDEINYNENNLLKKIKLFFEKKNYTLQLDEFKKLSFDQLISAVCMVSPFSTEEKQKLIETIRMEDKIKVLEEIINFNLLDNQENKTLQ